MKSSVEYGHLWHAFADHSIDSLDRCQLKRRVGGREFGLLRDPCADFRSDENTLAIFRAAMDDAVANDIDI